MKYTKSVVFVVGDLITVVFFRTSVNSLSSQTSSSLQKKGQGTHIDLRKAL